ncbi:VrrA/YqfQ family protein [Oceanobacillus sojae]
MSRSPRPPFRNNHNNLRGIPREIRNSSGAAGAKGGSRGLSSLLSGGASQGLAQSGGISTLSKTLGGVQQVLGVVQSTAPLIQEYGPMIKNIPSMYRMVKAFKTFNQEDNEAAPENTTPVESSKSNIKINHQQAEPKDEVSEEIKARGVSTPKLYV